MTISDKPALIEALTELLGRRPDEHQFARYWRGLEDLPFAEVRRGITGLLKTWTGRTAPWPRDVRVAAATQARAGHRVAPEVAAALADGELHCDRCADTGWTPTTRDASHVYGPGVRVPAVTRCACRATNPLYQAKREAESRQMQHGGTGGMP